MSLYVKKYQIIRLLIALIPSAERRSKALKKIRFFQEMGENVHFQPRHLPADPKLIKIHNNASIASDVCFITHDIMHNVFNRIDPKHREYKSHIGCIEIMDNVFIGANTTILPNVRIGPNVIVAAGSVVSKDIPQGTVVGGVPARIIGSFDGVMEKRRKESELIDEIDRLSRVDSEWEKFNKNHV